MTEIAEKRNWSTMNSILSSSQGMGTNPVTLPNLRERRQVLQVLAKMTRFILRRANIQLAESSAARCPEFHECRDGSSEMRSESDLPGGRNRGTSPLCDQTPLNSKSLRSRATFLYCETHGRGCHVLSCHSFGRRPLVTNDAYSGV